MLAATLLALGSAVLHAGWNLVAKRSADPFLALWGQFAVAAVIGAVVLLATRSLPAGAWVWAAIAGTVHIVYVAALAGAYDHGDFSVAYPIARGGGAVLAAVGGVVALDDHLSPWTAVAIAIVAGGMGILAIGAHGPQVRIALVVAVTIGIYTTTDSHAARTYETLTYPFATFVMTGLCVSAYGWSTGRAAEMTRTMRVNWRQYALTGATTVTTYTMVVLAVRRAPVGYVAALRESSVLLAAFLGARYLAERQARRRSAAAVVIMGGLVLLIATG